MDARYWCYMCSQMVDPVLGMEIKCPFCDGGFVEEMGDIGGLDAADLGSDRALSLWAPILLGMLGSSRRRRRLRMDDEDGDLDYESHRDLEAILRRRRRSLALLQLLQAIGPGIDSDGERERDRDRESDRERERDHLLLINSFDQAILLQGSFDTDRMQHSNTDASAGASLGDYFVGPSLDLLLQHLAENDPNRYGTPPAKKEAVEALPTVKVEGNLGCPVCLEDFDPGADAKEMPCKHRFHCGCILPWLDLHSSCPVCRFQIPADGSKDVVGSGSDNRVEGAGSGIDAENERNEGRIWLSVPWPFNEMLSLSGSQGGGNSSAPASGSNSHEDDC